MPFLNGCEFRAVTGGTGDFVVASATTGWRTPAQCTNPTVVDGGIYSWRAESDDRTQHEDFVGAYMAATQTVLRTTIRESSNGGLPVNFSAAPVVRQVVHEQDLGAGGGITNPLTADLDVGGFSIEGADGDDGGAVDIHGGAGAVNNGGNVTLTGGQGEVDGGSLTLTAGAGNTGEGGPVVIEGGTGDAEGGRINATAGTGVTGPGGAVSFTSGSGGTDGGDVRFEGGQGNGGNGGEVFIRPGNGSADGGDLRIELPPTGSGRQGLVIAQNFPTSDPSVTDALWSDGGVVVFSGSTAGGGLSNPLTADLDVGGFAIIGADDAVGGTDGGPIALTAGAGTTGNGGAITVTAGVGDQIGGSIEFVAGAGTNDEGGGMSFTGGDSPVAQGGGVFFTGGDGDTVGGAFSAQGGQGNNGDGGRVEFIGGSGVVGNGGSVSFTGGEGAVDGGDVTIALPAAGSGRQGRFYLINVETGDPADVGAVYVDGSGFLKLSL